jgi:hypothetical protein
MKGLTAHQDTGLGWPIRDHDLSNFWGELAQRASLSKSKTPAGVGFISIVHMTPVRSR